jgi:cytoskeletal protein RodZ
MSQKRRGANPEDLKTEADADDHAEVVAEVEPEVTETVAEVETELEPVASEPESEAKANVTINVVQVDGVEYATKEQLINAMGDQSVLAKAGAVITSSACSVCGYEPRYDPYGARVCPADSAECPIL